MVIVCHEAQLRIFKLVCGLSLMLLYSPVDKGPHARHLVWLVSGQLFLFLRFLRACVRVNGRSYSPDKQWALPILARENKNSPVPPAVYEGMEPNARV